VMERTLHKPTRDASRWCGTAPTREEHDAEQRIERAVRRPQPRSLPDLAGRALTPEMPIPRASKRQIGSLKCQPPSVEPGYANIAVHGSQVEPSESRASCTPQTHADEPESAPPGKTAAGFQLHGTGDTLPTTEQTFFEERLGHDFSSVRVHHDDPAARSAHDLCARAYTIGADIFFGRGQYAPGTGPGRRLLAHELAHVVQQRRGGPTPGEAGSPSERGADAVASSISAGRPVAGVPGATAVGVARQPTYGNLPRDPPESTRDRVRLQQNADGTWTAFGRRGAHTPRGKYAFVIQNGEIWAVKPKRSFARAAGHTEAALGGRVSWAGEMEFEAGKLLGWTDNSGHYRPASSLRQVAIDAGLPKEKWKGHPEGQARLAGESKVQLPMEQPETKPRTPGAGPKVGPGPPRIEEFEARYGREPPAVTAGAADLPKKNVQQPVLQPGGELATKAPAALKPAPAKPPAETPTKPKPHAKPPASKPAASKPTAAKPTASKSTGSTAGIDVSGPQKGGGRGGSRTTALTGPAAAGVGGALLGQAMNELTKIAAQNPGDKDLAAAVGALTKGIDAKSFVQNPTQFIAGNIKAELIQGVFNKFSTSLNTTRQSFEEKFPDVRTLHKNPLETGVSLEDYEKNYDRALAALRVPDARKALVYVAVLIGLDENAPTEEIERRIALANRELAKLPGLGKYVAKYYDARDRYGFALAVLTNRLGVLGDEWANQPAGLADELRRRGKALDDAAGVLYDAHRQLWESGLVVWAPVLSVAMDLQTLAQGFGGLGAQLREFADVVSRRKGEYDLELSRLQAEAARVAAQAVRAF
jgi:hypothetical protein